MLVGPSVAGILLTGFVYGKAGLRQLLHRLLRWRVGARWYAVALLTVPLLVTAVLLALSLTSPIFLPGTFTSDDKAALLLVGMVLIAASLVALVRGGALASVPRAQRVGGIAAVAAQPYDEQVFEGLTFTEAMSVTLVQGGIAINVIPDRAEAQINFRYAPGRTPQEAEERLREVCSPFGELTIDSNAPSGAVPSPDNAALGRLRSDGDLGWEPKQAWTPVAEFAAVGVDAVNFGPGDPRFAHRRDEQVAVAALARSYDVLERLLR